MKVLFLQGYLWRDRFPAWFQEGKIGWYNGDIVLLTLGLLFAVGGLSALGAGYVLTGTLLSLFGLGFVLGIAQRLGIDRLGGSNAFWVSLEWSAGTLTVIGTLGIIVASYVAGYWPVTLLFMVFLFFPEAPGIKLTWERYLFFSDPVEDERFLHAEPSRNPLMFWFDTFCRLPWQVVVTIIVGSTRPRPDNGSTNPTK